MARDGRHHGGHLLSEEAPFVFRQQYCSRMSANTGKELTVRRSAGLRLRGDRTVMHGLVVSLVMMSRQPILSSGFTFRAAASSAAAATVPVVELRARASLTLRLLRPPGRDPAVHSLHNARPRPRAGPELGLRASREVDIEVDVASPRHRANVTIRIPQFFYAEEYLIDNENVSENNRDGSSSAASGSATTTSIVPPYPSPLHHIHVVPLLSRDEASTCLRLATTYASETKCWDRPDFQRHETYATCDFCVDDCVALREHLGRIGFEARIVEELAARYQVDGDDLEFLDLFCAHYVAKPADATDPPTEAMDRLEPHRDGSVVSFTVLLSPPSDFEGGGTFFDALRDEPQDADNCLHEGGVVRPKFAGDAVLHSGKVLHGADAVTRGSRTVLVGFVSASRWQRPGALAAACRDWGRMDVARWRSNRHARKCGGPDGMGWQRSTLNRKWLPKQRGRSDVRSYCPNFATVWKRADPEFQRRYKLRAEDMLLRRILLQAPRDLPAVHLADVAPSALDDVTVL